MVDIFEKKTILTLILEFLPLHPLHPYSPYSVVLVTLDIGERSSQKEKKLHEILRISGTNNESNRKYFHVKKIIP